MTASPIMTAAGRSSRDHDAWSRAVVSRDPRFDGVFYVGISTTGIYCRPVCPARVSYPERRRFFPSAAAAEQEGYRPCLRCRPELAPGLAVCDAVPRVARAAAMRIAAGALNGRSVAELAQELGVSERHLRRAMERELGVSPVELAQTHRLLMAKCLLTDTDLPVTRIAYASGFQSLRRFNTMFQERYRLSPSMLRQRPRPAAASPAPDLPGDWIRLRLGYRAPLSWDALVQSIAPDTPPGVGVVDGSRYGRTVALEGCRGVIFVDAEPAASQVIVDLSASLLPALMPLLARLRHLLDLDAEPAVIDAHLEQEGLAYLIAQRPGLRLPGAFDGFEVAARELLGIDLLGRVTRELGEPFDTGIASLDRLGLTPYRAAEAGRFMMELGVPVRRAEAVSSVAQAIADGALRLEPGCEVPATLEVLTRIPGVDERTATAIVMRALHWPDAFWAADPELQRAAGVRGTEALRRVAERWRPWRGYAAAHLRQ
ncbi:MAG TPA: AlkA N-terminal domain-containing protein [Gemmatimonadales bacterium]|nr:AlkA N-terminal domain-containing protein [Gemmatimonadales bacterium]